MVDPETFQSYRPLLFGIAYRMLGSASEAEDVVQDAYIRYAGAPSAPIRALKPYLSTIVTRLCLDRLKAARTTREQYFGPWLPEPLRTDEAATELSQRAEQTESITIAFLVLLETLSPLERAVFLLHEVFEYEHAEVAAMLAISPANARQVFSRAKKQVIAGRPRFQATPDRQQQLVAGFLTATRQGDLQALTRLLAEEVVFCADGGGKVPSATRPVVGRTAVGRLIIGLVQKTELLVAQSGGEPLRWTYETVNGAPALLIWLGGTLDSLWTTTQDAGQIQTIYAIRNPAKLAYLQRQLHASASAGS